MVPECHADVRALAEECALETPWVWYGHFPCASNNYGSSYMELARFGTVAEFWRCFNHFPSIQRIHDGTLMINNCSVIAFSLFREGVLPEWEDPVNIKGSEWGCRENLDERRFKDLWVDYILGAIGEQIPHCVGIRAINKSNRTRLLHKVEVWMDATETRCVQECRRSLNTLNPTSPKFLYMPHQDKQHQAQEYLRKRRRSGPLGLRARGAPYEVSDE